MFANGLRVSSGGVFPLTHCQTVYKVKVNIFCQESNTTPLEFDPLLYTVQLKV